MVIYHRTWEVSIDSRLALLYWQTNTHMYRHIASMIFSSVCYIFWPGDDNKMCSRVCS